MRAPRPVDWTATPIIRPPKIIQAAVEWNPENTTFGVRPVSITAKEKNRIAVKYSGTTAVAHSATVTPTTLATCITPSDTPSVGGAKYSANPSMAPKRAKKRRSVTDLIREF